MTEERREYQRLNLTQPLDGWFGDYAVRLVDVSATGALIEPDDERIPQQARALVRFYWRGEELEILAETARTEENLYGLRFLEDSALLRRMIATSATELLRAQVANASGIRDENSIGEETLTAASSSARLRGMGFTTHRWIDGAWKAHPSLLPDQPHDGFTIAAGEAREQVELLRQTYQSGDAEARRLTRMLAELSVADAKPRSQS